MSDDEYFAIVQVTHGQLFSFGREENPEKALYAYLMTESIKGEVDSIAHIDSAKVKLIGTLNNNLLYAIYDVELVEKFVEPEVNSEPAGFFKGIFK